MLIYNLCIPSKCIEIACKRSGQQGEFFFFLKIIYNSKNYLEHPFNRIVEYDQYEPCFRLWRNEVAVKKAERVKVLKRLSMSENAAWYWSSYKSAEISHKFLARMLHDTDCSEMLHYFFWKMRQYFLCSEMREKFIDLRECRNLGRLYAQK